MVYGSPAGHSSHQGDVVGFQEIQVDFGIYFLVITDDDRRTVLPKIKHWLVQWEAFEAIFVEGHVVIGIGIGVS
jgi:hypothetical protein